MLRWAILGTSFISETVAEAINASNGSRTELIVGRSSARCAEFQQKFRVPRQSNDMVASLADPDVDVVYVGLPNHLHRQAVEQTAAAGKAVVCEKPLASTMEDARAIIECVHAKQTFLVEGLMYLAQPLFRQLLAILEDGGLGRLRSVNGHYAADISQFVNPSGKGTIYNLGCYPASLLHLVMQATCGDNAFRHRSMDAFGVRSDVDGNISDAAVSVKFENGVLATLQSSDSYGLDYGFTVLGDKGVLRFTTNPWLPTAGKNLLQWQPYGGPVEDIVVDDDYDAFYHQIKMVETALAARKKEVRRPSPRHRDSLDVMDFLTQWESACR